MRSQVDWSVDVTWHEHVTWNSWIAAKSTDTCVFHGTRIYSYDVRSIWEINWKIQPFYSLKALLDCKGGWFAVLSHTNNSPHFWLDKHSDFDSTHPHLNIKIQYRFNFRPFWRFAHLNVRWKALVVWHYLLCFLFFSPHCNIYFLSKGILQEY